MSSSVRKTLPVSDNERQREGLYRTTIAGPGRSLADAFANIEHSPHVERVLRHPKRDLVSARVTLTPEEGEGYWELTRVRDDLYVILGDFAYKNPRYEFVPGDGLLQFNFQLSGDMTYAISRPGRLRFNRPALHLWRQPLGVDMREWTAPSAHERIVTIAVRPEFLLSQCLAPSLEVPPRLKPFVCERSSGGTGGKGGIGADYCQLPLTAQMLDTTTKLLENPYDGALYLLYQEALTLELLCVTVGNLAALSAPPTEEYSERELRCLDAARQLLTAQLAPAPALKKIARTVGMSEKALTRGFKAIYGETLFDFSLRCRMQYALTLLRDRNWSVDRVSEAVGYAHPTSFTAAFRRHFRLRPIDMKRLKAGTPIKKNRSA
jgi:AraC-like DNA-binding protein